MTASTGVLITASGVLGTPAVTTAPTIELADDDRLASYVAAVRIAVGTMETVRAAGFEAHDVPWTCIEAAHGYVFSFGLHGARAIGTYAGGEARKEARRCYGLALKNELRRPETMPDATPEQRTAMIEMLAAARFALVHSTWQEGVVPPSFLAREILGSCAAALVACGWTADDAWRDVMERFDARGGKLP